MNEIHKNRGREGTKRRKSAEMSKRAVVRGGGGGEKSKKSKKLKKLKKLKS